MDKETFLDLMDKYIDGELTDTEKYNFEQMIEENLDMKNKYQIHRAIREGIQREGREKLKLQLQKIKNEVKKEEERNVFIFKILKYAAVLTTGILGVLFLMKPDFIYKDSINTQVDRIYVGQLNVKILPLEGKLGASIGQKKEIVLISDASNLYYDRNDTIYIFTRLTKHQLFAPDALKIHINQVSALSIKTNSAEYIFPLKK